MKKTLICILVLTAMGLRAQKNTFGEKALADKLVDVQGDTATFASVLEAHKGKTILIDMWATWCADCIKGMPDVHKLMQEYTTVDFVFISLDKSEGRWKRGIKKYELEQGDHYWATKGWKSDLFDDIELDWIPRYMVIGPDGKIKLFRAIKASDKNIRKHLN